MSDTHSQQRNRPSPDALLAAAQREHRGHLKVFLGAAPGVGKTYAMLQAARQRKREGIDVVAGLVETHGRSETEALLDNLEVLPRQRVTYREKAFGEMDLDGILARHPQLVLVDELAHTNVPGTRHPKRYLDVDELIASGIDVYTTVNVQHLESLNDAVAQITGVRVHETIPDSVLENANEIQLIDLPPEELIQRLHEGKVYVPDQAERAIDHYFRPGNLNALRELALRRTADRVDDQMQDYMQTRAIPGPWPTTERIMVCVSPSPLSALLVRAAKRRADRRNAPWLAVYVETPAHYRLSEGDRDRVDRTLRLAEQLGAEAVTIPGNRAPEDLVRYAQRRNVTEIIIGKSRRSTWHRFRYGSIIDDLIRNSGPIDVYVISSDDHHPEDSKTSQPIRPTAFRWHDYGWSLLFVLVAAVLARMLQPLVSLPSLSLVFLLPVLLSAIRFGLWPSVCACVLSTAVYNFFFIPPVYSFTIASSQEWLAYVIYFVVAIITSNLAASVRDQAEAAKRREDRTASLFALSRAIAGAVDAETMREVIATKIHDTLGQQVALLLPIGHEFALAVARPEGTVLSEQEIAAASWAWQHNRPTGHGADTLPGMAWHFLPLKTTHAVVGVLGVRFQKASNTITPRTQRLLEALADQAAIGLDRANLREQMENARLLTETERLRAALLSSVSHDLRTPLASIIGSVSSLLDVGTDYDEATRKDLLLTIREEADRLDRFVGNLLDIMRLESGRLEPNRQWVQIDDLVGTVLSRSTSPWSGHRISLRIEPALPMLKLDFVLMQQVLFNLLDNAAKYSPAGSEILIEARRIGSSVVLDVSDEGVGVPADDIERIFDMFYRVRHGDLQVAGTGVGLAICRGIVDAHGGSIHAESPAGDRGTRMTIALPIDPNTPSVTEGDSSHA